jgi:proteic killer suppression protein
VLLHGPRQQPAAENNVSNLITLDNIIVSRYYWVMIKGFRCKETKRVFQRQRSREFSAIQKIALRKLLVLDAAGSLADLRIPPSNRLEKLAGDREGQHSIRINDQWRVCFRWRSGNAHDVEIVDYH